MATTIKPVVYICKETQDYVDHLANDIKTTLGKEADLLLDYPGIYIHVWRSKYDVLNGTYSIYVGETNDIIQRTREHWYAAMIPANKRYKGNWQYHMAEDVDENGQKVIPTVFFFGHPRFHKSMTLDIENRLIDYCYAMETAHVYNGRTNPQGCYCGDDDLDEIFGMIWKILRNSIPDLFLSESDIQKSAIYKASPNHKLTDDQKNAKDIIIARTFDAMMNGKIGQLIFVEGEAGTGKTVLTSSTYYEMLESPLFDQLGAKRYMLINHMEQKVVYENMARKLGYDESIVQNPTGFLKKHSIIDPDHNTYVPNSDDIADVVFVDEAHLLWNQRNQAYDTKFQYPQLEEIIRRSRVTVIMYDEHQVLHRGQVSSYNYMDKMRKLAMNQGPDPKNGSSNYIVLNNQLRMNCSIETMSWIDDFTKQLKISKLLLNKEGTDKRGYLVSIYDDPGSMHQAIVGYAKKPESQLSRMVATSDWPFISSRPTDPQYVTIDDWAMLWNDETFNRYLYATLSKREMKKMRMLDWAEKEYSINEVGSTFTVQGFDLSYVGVIIGPSVKYDKIKQKVYIDEKERKMPYMIGNRKLDDGTEVNVTELISKNELRVLMTRGTKGLLIYACDKDLREALKEAITNE